MLIDAGDTGEWQSDLCSHHWMIESPGGETSIGTCKACGATRAFRNHVERHSWTHRPAGVADAPIATPSFAAVVSERLA